MIRNYLFSALTPLVELQQGTGCYLTLHNMRATYIKASLPEEAEEENQR